MILTASFIAYTVCLCGFNGTRTNKKPISRLTSIDFRDAPEVFAGPTVTYEDNRFDYSEQRLATSVEPVGLPTTGSSAAAAGTGRQRPGPPPGVRALRTTLRTAHLLAFGALYGGHLYGVPAERLWPALLATVATGGAFMSLEIYRTPIWLVQLRGVATLVKIALVAAVAIFWNVRVWLLTAAIIIAGISSHMPGRYRYYSVLHGRVVGDQDSG